MSKSSLSKIVRTYIEQAKDGSANHYVPPASKTATINMSSNTKKTTTAQKPKTSAGLMTDQKTQPRAGKVQNNEPILQANNSKNISLNNSQLQRSPSKTRAGQIFPSALSGATTGHGVKNAMDDRQRMTVDFLNTNSMPQSPGEGGQIPKLKESPRPAEKSKTQLADQLSHKSKTGKGTLSTGSSGQLHKCTSNLNPSNVRKANLEEESLMQKQRLTERRMTHEREALGTDSQDPDRRSEYPEFDDEDLTELRDSKEAFLTTNASPKMPRSGKESLIVKDPTEKVIGKTNRSSISTTAAIKSLTSTTGMARNSHKERKDKLFGASTQNCAEKFSTIRKLTASQTITNHSASLSSNGSFTFKSSLGKNALQGTKTQATTQIEPARKYLIASEIPDLDRIMETANLDDFRMENLLGKGAYASTYFGTHITTGLGVAMKVYTFNEKNHLKDAIDSEVKILKKLNHPNIVKLFQCFEKEKKTVLVLELCPPRSLQDCLRKLQGKKMEEDQAKAIFMQLLSTIDYFHSKNIAHCDLKFENILYDENTGELKVIDFGFSVEDPVNNPPTFLCGTPSYMSPEEIMKKNIDFFKADIWSCGVILFKLVTGLFPFRAKTESDLNKKIIKGEFSVPTTVSVSSSLKRLLKSILNPQVDKRPLAKQLMSDPWLCSEGELDKEQTYLE